MLYLWCCTNLRRGKSNLCICYVSVTTTEDSEKVSHEDFTENHCRAILLIDIKSHEGRTAIVTVAANHVRLLRNNELICLAISAPQHIREWWVVGNLVTVCLWNLLHNLVMQAFRSCEIGGATIHTSCLAISAP